LQPTTVVVSFFGGAELHVRGPISAQRLREDAKAAAGEKGELFNSDLLAVSPSAELMTGKFVFLGK
jgi:hypothetical protein